MLQEGVLAETLSGRPFDAQQRALHHHRRPKCIWDAGTTLWRPGRVSARMMVHSVQHRLDQRRAEILTASHRHVPRVQKFRPRRPLQTQGHIVREPRQQSDDQLVPVAGVHRETGRGEPDVIPNFTVPASSLIRT